jgi:hypothetical protein
LIGVRDGGDDDDDAPAVAAAAPDPVTDIMTQSVNHCHYICATVTYHPLSDLQKS